MIINQIMKMTKIVLLYGKKELVEEFLEKFNNDRQQDGAELKAILLEGEMKKEVKKFIWKGD